MLSTKEIGFLAKRHDMFETHESSSDHMSDRQSASDLQPKGRLASKQRERIIQANLQAQRYPAKDVMDNVSSYRSVRKRSYCRFSFLL